MICQSCGTRNVEGARFCSTCGGGVSAAVAARLGGDPGFVPTVVMRTLPGTLPGAGVDSDHHDDRSKKALYAIGMLAVVLVGIVFFLLVLGSGKSHDSSESSGSAAPATNRTTTAEQPAATTPGTSGTAIPQHAVSKYGGVNIRALPDRNAALITTIGSGEQLLIFNESTNYDTILIQSEHKSVSDNWSEVELAKNSSIHGWVFNGFITKY